ncbi:MAG: glycerol-3-phosphate dehydrogenase/oxidase [Verrucomicrobia bacterium]|nr:glycerol-3-phosphate dehydrogenase/oxidase [Verrucomicrobiota bacterium]
MNTDPLDLLIIGGGIVGAGVARDAAMRGLRVGLVEQHDFAFGTSSRSSRLLHGGLRYLAQGRLGLVRQASVEKGILRRIAPHLTEPLAFVFPTYCGTAWPLWQLRIGVKIYDLLCGGRNLGRSRGLSRSEVLNHVPMLNDQGLTGAVRYFDGFTNDARLVLDTLRSAAKAGAIVLNYVRFANARYSSGIWECELSEELNATSRSRRRKEADLSEEQNSPPPYVGAYTVRARAVVNATGPWADGLPHSHIKLRLTKGIHLVVDRGRLPVTDAMVMTEGKRILFLIPWGERVIIGTTDTDYRGPVEAVRTEPDDIQYLLRIVGEFFPTAGLSGSDVISTWAGLRPLLADPGGKPSDISRTHEINNPEPFWWDVAGGKLTTYRLMAEQTVDRIAKRLGGRFEPCRTAVEPLLPPAETTGLSGILPPEFNRHVVEHFCANEWAVHLDDVMVRRANWHHYYHVADQKAEQVADWMGESLGWSREEREAELNRYRAAGHRASERVASATA